MLKRVLTASRWFTLIAIVGALFGSTALLIEALDVFLIAIVGYIIGIGLYVLFMREAVAWDGERDLLGFGVALAG